MLRQRFFSYGLLLGAWCLLNCGLAAQARADVNISMSGMGVVFQTPAEMTGHAIRLGVSGPGDWVYGKDFQADETLLVPYYQGLVDGQYQYELKAQASQGDIAKKAEEESEYVREGNWVEDENGRIVSSLSSASTATRSVSAMPEDVTGSFRIVNGALFIPDEKASEEDGRRSGNASERVSATSSLLSELSSVSSGGISPRTESRSSDSAQTRDDLTYDDKIITGSLCVGFDCVNGESFGYMTTKLKENNLRLSFEDTSTSTFPTRDWQLIANDTTSGGASYFSIFDTDGGRHIFRLEAGAPANSLYVEDYGRVGLGTSIPYVELHITDGDSPTVRLDQDGSSGWAAQRWDVCGNETNFFIRDVTNGSKLCVRIQPNTPSNTLCLRSTGNVGIGTWSPAAQLHVTEGVFIQGDIENPVPQEMLGALHVVGDAYINGNLELASSRELKDHIATLDGMEAVACLKDLTPVSFEYKQTPGETQLGFIAEDVPELVASSNRKGLNPMDIAAVLTRVVQEQQSVMDKQQTLLDDQQALLGEQRRQNEAQQAQIEALQNRLAALEAQLTK